MTYKIELRYAFEWDDAEWTEEGRAGNRPLRFSDRKSAQAALAEFFDAVKIAVSEGNIDVQASPADYRIVETPV